MLATSFIIAVLSFQYINSWQTPPGRFLTSLFTFGIIPLLFSISFFAFSYINSINNTPANASLKIFENEYPSLKKEELEQFRKWLNADQARKSFTKTQQMQMFRGQ